MAKTQVPDRIVCPVCQTTIKDQRLLLAHANRKHPESDPGVFNKAYTDFLVAKK